MKKRGVTFMAAVAVLTAGLLIGEHLSASTENPQYSNLYGAEKSGQYLPEGQTAESDPGKDSPGWQENGTGNTGGAEESAGAAPIPAQSPDLQSAGQRESSPERGSSGDSLIDSGSPEAEVNGNQQATKEISTAGGRANYQEYFGNALFIGDSITEGISFYGFVKEHNVYSKLGLTLSKACEDLDKVTLNNPQTIYLMFGANDLEINNRDDYYLDNYRKLLAKLKYKWPDAEICIQSVLPLRDGVENNYQNLSNRRIRTINAKLADLAVESGDQVHYIDLTPVHAQFTADIYEKDGIHFKRAFYPAWLDYLVEQMN